jgi:hypothetical protein
MLIRWLKAAPFRDFLSLISPLITPLPFRYFAFFIISRHFEYAAISFAAILFSAFFIDAIIASHFHYAFAAFRFRFHIIADDIDFSSIFASFSPSFHFLHLFSPFQFHAFDAIYFMTFAIDDASIFIFAFIRAIIFFAIVFASSLFHCFRCHYAADTLSLSAFIISIFSLIFVFRHFDGFSLLLLSG